VMEFRVDKAQTQLNTGGYYGFELSPDDDDGEGGDTNRDNQIWWNNIARNADAWDFEQPWGVIFLSPNPLVTTPTAPTNLHATAGDQMVRLTWNAPPGSVNGYRVYQSQTAGGSYTQATSSTMLRADVTGLTNGIRYYFVVRAFNSAGEGPQSNEDSAIPQSGISLRARGWDELQ
jgi:hypothetical protein